MMPSKMALFQNEQQALQIWKFLCMYVLPHSMR